MGIKVYKAMTPGTRGMSVIDYRKVIDKVKPLAKLTAPIRKSGGRNNTGRITVRHRGGGVRKRYRICLLYTSPSPRDATLSRMPSSA